MVQFQAKSKGFTLIELVISVALVTIIFTGVVFGIRIAVYTLNYNKHKAEAILLTQHELEDITAISYAEITADISPDDSVYDLIQDWTFVDADNFYALKIDIDDTGTNGQVRITAYARWPIIRYGTDLFASEFRTSTAMEDPPGSGNFFNQEQMTTLVTDF